MPVGCFEPRGDSQPGVVIIIKDDVPDLTGHMVSLQGGFDQAMWNGPIGVGQVQTQNGQITS